MKHYILVALLFIKMCNLTNAAAAPKAIEGRVATAGATAEAGLAVAPFLQNATPEAVSILWRTAQPAYGWVEYGETEALGKKADRVVDGLRAANTREHRVRLSGLKPGTTYFYRAGYKAVLTYNHVKATFAEPQYSAMGRFTTAAPDAAAMSCCILNDLHNKYPTFEAMAGQIRKAAPDAVIFNGDCFANPASEEEALKALRIFTAGMEAGSRPAIFVRGNHETRGAYARDMKALFEYPEGKYYFGWTLGPVRFVVLDTGEDKADDHVEYYGMGDFAGYRQEQAEWLKRELASEAFKKAKYHVLVYHMPLYGKVGRYGEAGRKADREAWEPVLNGAKFDLAVCGHTHRQEIIKAGEYGAPYPVVVGGGNNPEQGATMTLLRADENGLEIKQFDAKGMEVGALKIGRSEN